MDYHTITDTSLLDVAVFEKASMDKIGLIPEILPRYRSTYFSHIFSGVTGYSAGYYSYIWAEVLDCDAYQAFKEKGNIFDQELAKSFRNNILARGGVSDAMEMYKSFRGKEPSIDALLEKRGLK
jgi:peptidyl-dipeptidase Dcp